MVDMKVGVKHSIFFLGLFLYPYCLFSQEINCAKSIGFHEKNDLLVAVNEYNNMVIEKSIILVDFIIINDTINVFYILGSKDIFTLFYKKPDCYFIYNKSIVYIYTSSYTQLKDSIWLQNLFDETRNILCDTSGEINIFWLNDSVADKRTNIYFEGIYEPWVVEYQVSNGIILKKIDHDSMYYPYISYPRGITTIENILPINKSEQITHIEVRQNIADTLEHFDKMGKDSSYFLNKYEAEYFNVRFQRDDFDFTDKKVVFFGPGGLVFSDKQRYFNELTRHTFVESSLHIFNETEREKAGGFDAAIVYWNKRNYSSEDLLKRLKESR
jgi:hypothetical protein